MTKNGNEFKNVWVENCRIPETRKVLAVLLAVLLTAAAVCLAFALLLWLFLMIVVPPAGAGELTLHYTNPCVQPDSTAPCESLSAAPESGLASIVVKARRFRDWPTELDLGPIPASGRECLDDSVTFEFQNGTMGDIRFWAKDDGENVSCTYASYVFAIPADSTWDDVPIPTVPGLLGEYFDNLDLTDLKLTRVDQVVNYNWGLGSPNAAIAPDSFSVRWTGFITPAHTETYTLYAVSQGGISLYLDGALLVQSLADPVATEHPGTIPLVAGRPYPIRLEYFDNVGPAIARLRWSSMNTPKATVPVTALSH